MALDGNAIQAVGVICSGCWDRAQPALLESFGVFCDLKAGHHAMAEVPEASKVCELAQKFVQLGCIAQAPSGGADGLPQQYPRFHRPSDATVEIDAACTVLLGMTEHVQWPRIPIEEARNAWPDEFNVEGGGQPIPRLGCVSALMGGNWQQVRREIGQLLALGA